MSIDDDKKDSATQAIREAREIDDALTERGYWCKAIKVPIKRTPEFWAGIQLLLGGEYLITETGEGYLILSRKVKPT